MEHDDFSKMKMSYYPTSDKPPVIQKDPDFEARIKDIAQLIVSNKPSKSLLDIKAAIDSGSLLPVTNELPLLHEVIITEITPGDKMPHAG